jgi:hypothetical protein
MPATPQACDRTHLHLCDLLQQLLALLLQGSSVCRQLLLARCCRSLARRHGSLSQLKLILQTLQPLCLGGVGCVLRCCLLGALRQILALLLLVVPLLRELLLPAGKRGRLRAATGSTCTQCQRRTQCMCWVAA